jgi:hypothetical protein
LLNIEIDNTPCIVAVDITERKKSRRALKGNECAVYFENDESSNAAELSLPIPNCFFQNEQKEKRAAELIANNELIFQNKEKLNAQQN